MKLIIKASLLIVSLLAGHPVTAGGVYQEPDEFINQVFENNPPKAKVLWLDEDLKKQMADILSHSYKGLRIRYWQQANATVKKSVWILDEIGKEKPITTGIVINNGKIELVKVLVFRESRGWEVRHDFFTDQFKLAKLKDTGQLDRDIDNVSGATLSVRAVSKLARIALLLDKKIQPKKS